MACSRRHPMLLSDRRSDGVSAELPGLAINSPLHAMTSLELTGVPPSISRKDFMAVNLAHGNLRRRFISAERAREVQESIGEKSFEVFVSSGITGLTPGKVRLLLYRPRLLRRMSNLTVYNIPLPRQNPHCPRNTRSWSSKVRDAKCLHAHVADALMRGREANAIGSSTLDLLEARGVGSSGCDRCREQCDYNMEETEDTWR